MLSQPLALLVIPSLGLSLVRTVRSQGGKLRPMGALHSWSNIFPEDDTDVLFLDQFKSTVSGGPPVGDPLALPSCQNDDGALARRFHSACWPPLSLSITLFFFSVPHVHDHGPPFFPSSSPSLFPCRNLAGPYGLYARHRPGGGVTKRARRLGGQCRARCDAFSFLFLFPSLPPSLRCLPPAPCLKTLPMEASLVSTVFMAPPPFR
jgi:hypothetical protein